jgi:hypothetical protein
MKTLWTFETREKLTKFVEVLASNEIGYETQTKSKTEHSVLVDERDYAAARKLLLKHRERRTSADLK